jgi:biotin carboxylase
VVEGDSPQRARTRVLVLGAGPAQLGLLAAAREHGLFVIAADRDPGAPGFRYADRRAIVSAEDEVGIERLADAERIDGIVAPGIDWPVAIAARIAHRLGLPHPISPESAALATSKLRQRERFGEAGVPQPRYELCRTVEEAGAAAERLGYPCVVKAPDRQGQRGLGLVRSPADVEPAAAEALRASRGALCLVEEYATGRELTVNAFLEGGRFHSLTVTDRHVADPPAFGVALAHVWPSALEAAEVEAAVAAARAAAEALGITDGPTYTQILAGPHGPRVVELAARLGGGHDAELCRAALGVDLNRLALAAAVGEEIDQQALVPKPAVGGACVRFLVAPAGPLRTAEAEEASSAPGIVSVYVYREPGFIFVPLRRGADRAGAVIAVGDSREQALERADAAASLVRFEIEDAGALV